MASLANNSQYLAFEGDSPPCTCDVSDRRGSLAPIECTMVCLQLSEWEGPITQRDSICWVGAKALVARIHAVQEAEDLARFELWQACFGTGVRLVVQHSACCQAADVSIDVDDALTFWIL